MISNKQQTAYADAFSKCYPGKSVDFKPGKDGSTWVLIEGDKGTRPLSTSDVLEAVEMFER